MYHIHTHTHPFSLLLLHNPDISLYMLIARPFCMRVKFAYVLLLLYGENCPKPECTWGRPGLIQTLSPIPACTPSE